MSKKVSQLVDSSVIDGQEFIPISKSGSSFKITLNKIKSLFTKADVGLSQVDNTSDAEKPLSIATVSAFATKADLNHTHSVSQISTLSQTLDNKANLNHSHNVDSVNGLQSVLDTKANTTHIHSVGDVSGLSSALLNKADVSHQHSLGDVAGLSTSLNAITTRIDNLNLAGAVSSVNGLTGDVVLSKYEIGLSNVDNTSDLDKPISAPQKTYVDNKVNVVLGTVQW